MTVIARGLGLQVRPVVEMIVGNCLDDAHVFSHPWKISMALYKHIEKNAQLLEFKCVEFVEDVMYG